MSLSNREIKFKYYAIGDESKKVCSEIFTLDEIESYPKDRIWNFAESMCENLVTYRKQFTGLQDKNLEDIYEGDILKVCNGSINGREWFNKPCEVKWKPNKGWDICLFMWDNKGEVNMDSTHWCEVIGNIYENPELLKG